MQRQNVHHRHAPGLSRRQLLQASLAAAATLSAWSLSGVQLLWGGEPGQPKRGGILRVRGWDPPHFDPHLTIAVFTQQPYVKNYAPTQSFDYGSRAAALWLDR
jgi:hypothetical protein